MTDILRRGTIALDPEYPPGNQYSIDLPNPRLVPRPARPLPSLQNLLPSTVTPAAAPTATPAPAQGDWTGSVGRMSGGIQPLAPGPSNFQGQARTVPMPQAGQLIAPPTIAPPVAARPTAAPPRIAPAAQRQAFSLPTTGPRLQGFQAGTQAASQIASLANNPTYLPQAGSGIISSSNGNAYSIRPPTADERAAEAPQPGGYQPGSYQPKTMFGLLAGLSIQQMARNNELRAQKLQISQDAEMRRLGNERTRLGIEQQNADTAASRLDQERYQVFHKEVPSADGLSTTKVPYRINVKTGEASPVLEAKAGPSFEQFKSGVANVPQFKGMDDAKLMDYWKRNHGGQ